MIRLSDIIGSLDVLEIQGPTDIVINQIKTDSRDVEKGDLFVALKGSKANGHDFISDALNRGASCVVYESPHSQEMMESGTRCFIRVKNTSIALAQLASAFYNFPSKKLKFIGITGTNGKTSTAIFIEHILKEAGFSTGRIGTLGYCWNNCVVEAALTTPDPLQLHKILNSMVKDGIKAVVMEVSSHALDQNRIFGCNFDVAIFTNLTQDHLDYHRTMDAYFEAKASLFLKHLSRDGIAVINIDDPYGLELKNLLLARGFPEINIITYGINNRDARVRATNVQCSPGGTVFDVEMKSLNDSMKVKSSLLGNVNVYNLLAAIASTLGFVPDNTLIIKGIEDVGCVRGRLEKIDTASEFHVLVDYAHTPDALARTLECVKEWTEGQLIVVFGCGGDRDRTKRPLMAQAACRFGDVVIITSDNPRSENPRRIIEDILQGIPQTWTWVRPEVLENLGERARLYTTIVDRKQAIEQALSIARPKDVIVIAGKGHETYQIVGSKKIPFDDKQVVLNCLRLRQN